MHAAVEGSVAKLLLGNHGTLAGLQAYSSRAEPENLAGKCNGAIRHRAAVPKPWICSPKPQALNPQLGPKP